MSNKGMNYNEARRRYEETQRRKEGLPDKDKRLLKRVDSVKIGNYGVRSSVMLMISNVYDNNALNAFNTIFCLGFMQGMKSVANKEKMNKSKMTKKDEVQK